MTRELVVNIHSIMGVIVFLVGVLQIILKKGGQLHRVLGKTYVLSWIVLLISGAYIGGFLITIVGVFGFYFALTGSRLGSLKNKPFNLFDKSIIIIGILISLSMFYYSASLLLGGNTSFGIIFAVFGAIFAFSTVQDFYKYVLLKPLKKDKYGKRDWFFEHLTRMYISFIAALTAFTSIQNLFGENTLNFLLPTVFGIIGIVISKRFFEKKMIRA